MAEGVLFDVAKGITEKVGSLVTQKIVLLWNLKDEIEKLNDTVLTISAVIQDAEKNQQHNYQARVWLERLNDALYEADDLVDDISTEALRRDVMIKDKKAKEVHIFISKSNQLAYGLRMGHKVKAMRERLDDIAGDRRLFCFEQRLVETQVGNYRVSETHEERLVETQVGNYRVSETHSFVRSEEVIGRDKDKEEIIRILLDTNVEEGVLILPIVGLGGLGKTTLAQLIFNDKEIEKHFEQKLWVCVSDNFDVKVIVKKILECAKNMKPENLEMNTLINDLEKEIDGKRYLLALDDVWNEDPRKWLELKNLLMGGARGSRILVTTRSNKVARITKTVQPYLLVGLDKENSWSLFKQMAFQNGKNSEKSIFKTVGKEILKRCKGVPLAIRTIGSLLYFKNTGEEWLYFKDSELSKVPQEENDILPILKLSYDHLSSNLKQCFAYCCLFPKDYKIHKPTLIQMWMAQGFIRPLNQNQRLEYAGYEYVMDLQKRHEYVMDVLNAGHEYVMDLLRRSFFQEVEKDEGGNILQFKMHDLMHDLAKLVAGSYSTTCNSNEEIIDKKTLHVSFGGQSLSQIPSSLVKPKRIRTFMLQGEIRDLNESIYSTIIASFTYVRLLDLHNMDIRIVPSSINKLRHLRYLDLSYNEQIEVLPISITKLYKLQTLKLTACTQLKELPRNITQLVNLVYLDIRGCIHMTPVPHELEQLTHLRIVRQSVVGKDLRENMAIELLHGEDAALESKVANLKEKQYLQALKMHWIEDKVDEEDVSDKKTLEDLQPHPSLKVLSLYGYWGVSFPTWLPSLTNLVEFALFGCKKCQHLPRLDQFPNLKVLELDSLLGLECISKRDSNEDFSNSSFFPSLKELKLKYCPKLKGWWQKKAENHLLPTFPRLSKLCIRGCLNFTSMPLFPYLEKLELYYCSFKPLEQTTKIAIAATTVASKSSSSSSSSTLSNSSFTPFSELTSLEIGRMKEPLPEEFMQNLNSLNHLLIYECCGPLIQGIRHLSTLKILDICSSEVFDLPNDVNEMEWQGLRKLKFLSLFQLLELESLPVGLQHATSLQNLMLDYCPNLNTIPGWICNFKSLRLLQILQCPKLKSLPEGICGLTSLHTLEISKCFNLILFPQEMGSLTSLKELYISEVPNLISLPKGMHSLTSLCILDISKWPNLTSLPEWMGGLACLEALYISECPNLASLPKGKDALSSLKTLCIEDCPILLKRSERETGEDWDKIKDIPKLLRIQQGRNLDEEPNETPKKPAHKNWSLIKIFGCNKF